MRPSSWLWQAHPLRAIGEAVLLELILLGLLLASAAPLVLVGFSFGWMALICALLPAVRVRLPDGPLVMVLLRELGLTLLLTAALQCVLLLFLGEALAQTAAQFNVPLPALLLLTALFGLAFFPLRLVMHGWRLWDRTRGRRLLWAIVHTHLLTTLVLVLALVAVEGLRTAQVQQWVSVTGPQSLVVGTVLRLLIGLTAVIFVFIVAVPVIVVVMFLSTLLATITARPLVGRIEALMAVTAQLRAGQVQARIPVEGQDEIAQLQADFNAMADELEQALNALMAERDTVSGLLQTRRELVASVSHELRTPVATLRGHVESALANWGDQPPPTLRQDLQVMIREIERLGALLDDLFALSQVEAGRLAMRLERTDVGAVIRQVVEASAPLAWERSRVRVATDIQPGVPPALADARRLEQVLFNLIHNGLRHTPPGGIVAVIAQPQDSPPAVCIQVRDTGAGIAPEDLPRIWERFQRGADADSTHAGIGLALVRELTLGMGGSVTVESIIGQGSCFTLCLPVAQESPEAGILGTRS